ncbi:hypothetical protein HYX03_02340 [Candidatus Woesearchaeota archaeon]|nr:hypothetical protein [Candidatus Woesearchaeota archaeon]
MKKSLVFAVIAMISLLVIAGIAMAQIDWRWSNKQKDSQSFGMGSTGMMHGSMMAYHEEMEKLMENGNYNDLVALREKLGFRIMPWVDNEDDFRQAQKIHEKMEKSHEENGFGGCPMMG